MRVSLDGLSQDFNGVTVLHDVCFDDDVSTLAIIGPSGSGKSTLLRIIGGLLAPSRGAMRVDDEPVVFDEKALIPYRARLGFVFQRGGLFHHLTARENIALPLRVVHKMPSALAFERADALLERFDLNAESEKRPVQLSGGQQQRVAIARAVAARPRLLLLDEPTSALDPEFTGEVLDLIRDLKDDGVRFIVVTHEMGFARRACEKLAFLHQGSLLEYGLSSELFSAPQTPELHHFLSRLLEWQV
jgi:polar amino acid transport system ATP-binding protein